MVVSDPAGRLRTVEASGPVTITEVDEGIFQFRTRSRSANSYLLRGQRKAVLIDCGLPSVGDAIAGALARVDVRPDDIKLLVLTHEHFDHVGDTARYADHAMIAAHPLAANKIALGDEFVTLTKAFGETAIPFAVDIWLDEPAVIDTGDHRFQVLHTPGHTSACLSLFEPTKGILLSADTVMPGGAMGGIFGSGNISDYIHSLERLAGLRIDLILPGHGRISTDAQGDIATALTRSRALLSDTRALVDVLDPQVKLERWIGSVKDLNR